MINNSKLKSEIIVTSKNKVVSRTMTISAKDKNFCIVDTLAAGGLDLMALMPCPVKVPFEQAFMEYLSTADNIPDDFLYCLEGHVNHHLSFYKQLDVATDKSELPKILITPGINRFMGKEFRDKFISKRVFAKESEYFDRPAHLQNELVDPNGYYFLTAVNPLIIAADKNRLGDLPVPQSWEDTIKPDYKKQLVLRAQNDVYCETVLFNFYSQFGEDGIRKLAPNIGHGCHPSEMAKHAGAFPNVDWPAVGLMPYFFARTIKNKDNVDMVWPVEGAIASPVTMLVQKDALPRLQPIIDFLTSPVAAQIWSNAFFCPPFSDFEYPIGNGKLHWLGWDFVYDNDAHEMFESLNAFLKAEMAKQGE